MTAKRLEAFGLELPDPFPCHVQEPANLRECPLSSVIEAEPQPEHLLPARRERRQKAFQVTARARILSVPGELQGLRILDEEHVTLQLLLLLPDHVGRKRLRSELGPRFNG